MIVWSTTFCVALASSPVAEARRAIRAAEQAKIQYATHAVQAAYDSIEAIQNPQQAQRARKQLARIEFSLPQRRRDRIDTLMETGLDAPEAFFEVASLYVAEAHYIERTEAEAMAICQESPGCLPTRMLTTNSNADGAYRRASALFERFVLRFPDHPWVDRARLMLADSLSEVGSAQAAIVQLNHLMGSELTNTARLHRADIWFNQGEHEAALRDYAVVAVQADAQGALYARTRAAECLRALGRHEEADALLGEASLSSHGAI